ncbi:MAG: Esterase/lipase [uncultured Phycisphaerae bacterium]|uniref:Esterase/lipase n=1 Tax=uncultured Phycisphaerae bacterium TaxID=904963 RepID=A0A6J4N8M4_9BACT|nr:MAG: Esterase/lipase [uncultured Phycisphaerae bacterium]
MKLGSTALTMSVCLATLAGGLAAQEAEPAASGRKKPAAQQQQEKSPALTKADPQMQAVMEQLEALGGKPIEKLKPAEARRQPSPADAVTQLIQAKGNVAPDRLPPVGRVEMKQVPGPDGAEPVPVRVYTPKGDAPRGGFPVIVYYHGGGWVIASIDTYDGSCRALTDLTGAVVVSVDYRQAPEHKFPAAHEDSYAALQHVMANAADFGGDPARVAVVGESAGGNLATAVCMMAQERGGKVPVHQGLVYPIADYAFDTPSYKENANAKPLNAAMMRWFFEHYLNSPEDGEQVIVSPLRAGGDVLAALPPATIITAEIDPLRSEGVAYAQKLKAAGVDVAAQDYKGVTHEFFGMGLIVDKAKAANAFLAGRLKAAFNAGK